MLERAVDRRIAVLAGAIGVALWLLGSSANAAQTVHLRLEVDGSWIEGDSTVTSMGRENTIECSSFSWGVFAPFDPASGALTGRRQYRTVKIVKPVDKTTPLLVKALAQNEPVTDAWFKFYRPDPGGSGAEQHYYTVWLQNGYIRSISALSVDMTLGGASAPPMMETVTFVFETITWTYEPNGATHTDIWGAP